MRTFETIVRFVRLTRRIRPASCIGLGLIILLMAGCMIGPAKASSILVELETNQVNSAVGSVATLRKRFELPGSRFSVEFGQDGRALLKVGTMNANDFKAAGRGIHLTHSEQCSLLGSMQPEPF